MSTVNLYDVLDVPQDCEIKEIKKAYTTLVKKFHPDKPGGDAEMFELVTHAYNVLVNPKSRQEYDEVYALSKQVESTHFSLKDKFETYNEALEKESSKKTKEESKIDFDKAFEEMDRKHGLNRGNAEFDKLTAKDTKRRLRDIELAREQDDIENIHEKLFEDGRFDLAKFNAAFDALHKGHNELIHHNGNPDAWNTMDDYGSFSSVDNYEELYTDDVGLGTSQFGSIKLDPSKKKKLTRSEVEKLSAADYTKGHNYRDVDYNKSLEERMREYQNETKKLEDREMDDYDTDPNCGGYGIFSGLGLNNMGTIQWEDDEDIKTRYERLLEMRRNDNDINNQ